MAGSFTGVSAVGTGVVEPHTGVGAALTRVAGLRTGVAGVQTGENSAKTIHPERSATGLERPRGPASAAAAAGPR